MRCFFAKNFASFYEKITFGTSDAWATSLLSHRPSEPAYYIVDCRISGLSGRSTRARGIWAIGQIGRWGNLIVSMDGYARTHVIMDLRDLPFLPQKYTTTIVCYIHRLYTTILFDIISSLQYQARIFDVWRKWHLQVLSK